MYQSCLVCQTLRDNFILGDCRTIHEPAANFARIVRQSPSKVRILVHVANLDKLVTNDTFMRVYTFDDSEFQFSFRPETSLFQIENCGLANRSLRMDTI